MRPIVCDYCDEQQVEDAFNAVTSSIGPVDVVVNNAGWGINSPFEGTSLEMWQEIMDVHCTGYFLVVREVVRTFIRQKSGGAIVFVTSDNASDQAAIWWLTAQRRPLRCRWRAATLMSAGKYGIRVNSV